MTGHSRWMRLARGAWVILALVYFGIFTAAFPFGYAANQQICDGDECVFNELTVEEVRVLEDSGISHQSYAAVLAASELLLLTWGALGVFIFLRRSGDWIGLVVSMALIGIGFFGLSDNVNQMTKQTPALTSLYNTLNGISITMLLLLMFLFPDGRFVPRWTRTVAIPLVVLGLADPLLATVLPPMENSPGTLAGLAVLLTGMVFGVIAQVRRFRDHSNLEQRQQTKWVIFGFLALMLVAISWTVFVELFPLSPGPDRLLFNLVGQLTIFLPLIVALPITMTISIMRYRLFAIDVIIKRTAVYGALTVTILIIYFVTVVVFQSAFRATTGQGDQLAIVTSTLLIAALFNPLRRRIQTAVNRRFFRGDYNAARTLSSFGESVRDEVDLERMQARLLATVQDTMQPAHLSLWVRQVRGEGNGSD